MIGAPERRGIPQQTKFSPKPRRHLLHRVTRNELVKPQTRAAQARTRRRSATTGDRKESSPPKPATQSRNKAKQVITSKAQTLARACFVQTPFRKPNYMFQRIATSDDRPCRGHQLVTNQFRIPDRPPTRSSLWQRDHWAGFLTYTSLATARELLPPRAAKPCRWCTRPASSEGRPVFRRVWVAGPSRRF
jgi:hypothetical protein